LIVSLVIITACMFDSYTE